MRMTQSARIPRDGGQMNSVSTGGAGSEELIPPRAGWGWQQRQTVVCSGVSALTSV